MKRLLEKISWSTRRINLSFSLFDLTINDRYGSWGFDFISFRKDHRTYNLFSFWFRLPNRAEVPNFTIDKLDILFLRRFVYGFYDRLVDRDMWGGDLNGFEKFILNFLEKIISGRR